MWKLLSPCGKQQMQPRRQIFRPVRKLFPGSERFELVAHILGKRLSTEQIAGMLRSINISNLRDVFVCSETIYTQPLGELGKELIIFYSRQSGTQATLRRAGSTRPSEIEVRLMPGHWEGEMIKDNDSSVGTLVVRTDAAKDE